jgi:hypothetical protein
LLLKLSGAPAGRREELLTDILEDNSIDLTITSVELEGVISFRCIDPVTLARVETMSVVKPHGWVESSRESRIGEEITLTDELSNMAFPADVSKLRGETWPLKIHSPVEVLKLIPDTVRTSINEDPYGPPILCLNFFANRDVLAAVEIKVTGLRSAENEQIARELTKIYRRVFNSKQEFLELPELYPNAAGAGVGGLGAFISDIATIALVNSSLGLSSDVSIIASGTENGVALNINKPSNTLESRKFLPLNVQLTETGLRILPGAIAP